MKKQWQKYMENTSFPILEDVFVTICHKWSAQFPQKISPTHAESFFRLKFASVKKFLTFAAAFEKKQFFESTDQQLFKPKTEELHRKFDLFFQKKIKKVCGIKKSSIFAASKSDLGRRLKRTFFDMMEKYIREQINRGLSDLIENWKLKIENYFQSKAVKYQ